MILHDDVTCLARVRVAEMRFEPALPIRVPERDGARRQDELARHEEVVGDGVGGEVGQIAQPEGAERIAGREIQDLLPDVPGMTVTAHRRVLLCHRGVGGDIAVQKIVRERTQQIGDECRELMQIGKHGLAQKDVRAGRPGVRDPGEQHEPHHSEPQRDGGLLHRRFLPLSNLRLHRQTERPRRTSRMVAAASSAVSSSSSCMTSANASSDVRRSSAASAALTMRCRTSRDAPTIASASILMEAMSWRTSVIAGPANPRSALTAARTSNAAAVIAIAPTRAATAMTRRLTADTTPTQVGSITKPQRAAARLSTGRAPRWLLPPARPAVPSRTRTPRPPPA